MSCLRNRILVRCKICGDYQSELICNVCNDWRVFEYLLSKRDKDALELFDRIVKFTNNLSERKRLHYVLTNLYFQFYTLGKGRIPVNLVLEECESQRLGHLKFRILFEFFEIKGGDAT